MANARHDAPTAVVLDDRREWLETDGRGGWASSTISGVNTRRYHALLAVAAAPPQQRFLLVNTLEETLDAAKQSTRFSCHRYTPDVIDPPGYRWLQDFRLDPWPVWRYRIGDVTLEKALCMRHGLSALIVRYRLIEGPSAARLRVRMLATGRPIHALHDANAAVRWEPRIVEGSCTWSPYPGVPALQVWHNAQAYRQEPWWYRRLQYRWEAARGLDAAEDCWSPGEWIFELAQDRDAWLVFDGGAVLEHAPDVEAWLAGERTRRAAIVHAVPDADASLQRLLLAADQFVVSDAVGTPAILAGYPWFGVWGRDAAMALPGLLLSTGRAAIARGVLEQLAGSASDGLVANFLPEDGQAPDHHAVDASLWFLLAVYRWYQATRDLGGLRAAFWKTMQAIVRAYWRGTRHGIRLDDDGLLLVGDAETALTWMDARVDGRPVTPRHGKPVEIQALWINALSLMAELAAALGEPRRAASYRSLADQAMSSFRGRFWCQAGGYLYDVVRDGERDESVRPNQLLAVGLPVSCVTPTQARAILDTVERALVTPYGLRTLSPANPAYRPRYAGGPRERDAAYHQGVVWPWWWGPFVDAAVRVHGDGPAMRRRINDWLGPLRRWILQEGISSLPELFDAEPPYAAGGTPAQAWSVAAVVQLCVRYGIGCAPQQDEAVAHGDNGRCVAVT